MSKRMLIITAALVAAAVLSITIFKFESSGKSDDKINPAFSGFISAFTSGIISNQSPVRIILANEVSQTVQAGQPVKEELFEFSPSIKGAAFWIDSRTIEFKPDAKLPSGQEYRAAFHLSKVVETPRELEEFEFTFQVIEQSFAVEVSGMTTIDKQKLIWQRVKGNLATADFADNDQVQKIVSATQNGKKLRIAWTHGADKTSTFTIDSIQRFAKKSEVLISLTGKPIEVTGKDSIVRFTIPALGDFKIMDIKVIQAPDQYVSIRFSDPLMEKQNVNGLLSMASVTSSSNNENISFNVVIEDNELRAYPNPHQVGRKNLTVEPGIKNVLGYSFKERRVEEIAFEELKPEVKLIGKGVILPNSQGLIFPFQAVSLKAVDVKVIKIFEKNVGQFLQVNNLDGKREMKRVGRQILSKKISLNKSELDYQKWNTYSLDLSDLIKTEPGAIYKVQISFKKAYSVYHCEGETGSEMEEIADNADQEDPDDDIPSNNDYYYYDDGYYDYEGEYNYSERDDPCENSYYRNKTVSRNILASDLGIIAKAGNNNSMTFAVCDLVSTKPCSGVTLELYNYQNQLITSIKTNGEGQASVEMKKKPFLLVAKSGNQRGYLKLDDGSSLSLSMFDVSGETVQKGIKGFIYGERGVWRPGDSLYLCFILEDKLRTLPPTHPVTFELSNPQGTVVRKMTKSTGLNGFYNFSTATEQSAPTGDWTARVSVGGAYFTKNIKIETIMPNRLKLKLDFGVDKIVAGQDIKGDLIVKWLMGATAKGLAAKVEVNLNPVNTTFKKYAEFNFDDPARRYSTETQTIFDGNLDENGVATIKPEFSASAAPGMLRASFTARVFEQGGAFSIDRFSMPYSPYESYVGLKMPKGTGWSDMLYTDTNNIVKIATCDANGNAVSKKKLTVQVYKVQWRWWWDSNDNELANYVGDNYHMPIQTETISTSNGKGQFVLRINRPDWGRFFVRITDEESGHATGQTVYVDWPYWYGKSDKGVDDKGATMLSFNADKPKYNVGEDINLVIPSSADGRALVSIENGSKVIEEHWVETKKGDTKYSFKASAEMTPNIYVNVSLIQPHAQTKNDLPIRMFGVIPLTIDDPNTHLDPELRTIEVWKPESKQTISVSEKNGKAMTYTIAVVDEGLLDLTHFQTPDPWNNFYAREALGVKTWDMYDMVLGAYGGKLQQALAIGGDGEVDSKEGKKANRFKPMVRFIGPYYLGKGEKKDHTVSIPQYIGSVRVMIVAGQDFAYGHDEKTVPVRTPLMILGTLPRVVGPNEEVELPVNVFAMDKKVKNVNVQVIPNNYFTMVDAPTKSVSFEDVGDDVVNFKMKVKSMLGVAKVKIIATSGNEKATFDIELDVRNPNPPVVNVLETVIEPGKNWSTPYEVAGMAGTNKGTIEVSNIPPIDLGKRLDYLIQYPHGCIEQTTSSVFPQLFVGDVMELKPNYKMIIEKNLKAGLLRLQQFTTSSGGFSYWPGDREPSSWGSNYAGHFMLEAQAKGYTVSQSMLDGWKRYQKKVANDWTVKAKNSYYYYYNDDLEQAYRLYTLALAKAPELGAMNRLREVVGLSNVAKWRLAAAYQVANYPEEAKKLAYNTPITVKDYMELSYSYGSDERDQAMIIETLTLMGEKVKAAGLVKDLSKQMSSPNNWMSTQTTAYSLIAISKFSGSGGSKEMSFSCSLNGTVLENKSTKLPISQIDMGIKGTNGGNVTVVNKGTGILYARVILSGIPEIGDQTSSDNDLNTTISYKTMDGKDLDPEKLEQGTDFYAELTVTNPGVRGTYKEMALTQIFPSGWEIHNTRMDESESSVKSSVPTYQDIRDDRVYTYFNLSPNETKTFRIILNATYMGRFYLPTVYCEAMYDNTINSRKPGKWIEIVKPGELQ